jgi:hypothetical protein
MFFNSYLAYYYMIDICGVGMSGSRRRDFSFLCEEFGEEFDKRTNDRDFLDLEEDGLDGILSQSLDLFEERRVLWKAQARWMVMVDALRLEKTQ